VRSPTPTYAIQKLALIFRGWIVLPKYMYIYKSTNHEHQKPRKSFKMEVFDLLQIYGGVALTSAVCVKMVIQYCNLWVKIMLTIFNAHSF
jgi:hypothetical protein